jgi:iron complex transport system substrate-binding protein
VAYPGSLDDSFGAVVVNRRDYLIRDLSPGVEDVPNQAGCALIRKPAATIPGSLPLVLLSLIAILSISSDALAGPVELQQANGSVLHLEQAAHSLITLSPHLTELVYAAGAGDRIIATVEYSNYPEEAEQLPRVGDAFRIDLERIVSLKPDLVIAWQSGNPMLAIARLEELGIPVWVVEIRQPEEIASSLEQIGLATASIDAANHAAEQSRQQLETIKHLGKG